jgi:hypothetical protein
MKIVFPFFFFILLFHTSGVCQYKKSITEGSEWHLNYQGLGAWNFSQIITGDTIINGIIYKKHIEYPWSYIKNIVREDSLNKKIYLHTYSTFEVLLYDFGLAVGDTFPGLQHQIVLDSITNTISSGLCGFNQHIPPILNIDSAKVFYFHQLPASNENPVVWVEGIGSLVSLRGNDQWWDGGLKILCHFDSSGIWDYHYTDCEIDTCLGPVYGSTEEKDLMIERVKIYPNPTAGEINVESTTDEIEKLEIYNLIGKKIKEYKINSNAVTISILNFKRGVYWGIFYFEKGKMTSKKIIIQ